MAAPTDMAHTRRKHRSPPAGYLRAVKLLVVFGAALTLLTLFESSSETDGDMSHRSLKAKKKKKKKTKSTTTKTPKSSVVNIDKIEWSATTEAFLPVLTVDVFKLYVETFRMALACFHTNGLNLIPTGGTLVGTLRHKGMIPWDDDIDVYYFTKDEEAIFDPEGPVQECLAEKGMTTNHYKGAGGESRKNLSFKVDGQHLISAFPASHKEDHIDFISQNMEERRSPMLLEDIFPLEKHAFHDYDVYLPHNVEKYLEVDWGKNQLDAVKTPTYDALMTTVISGHLHRGCARAPVMANITDVEFLEYYDPADYSHTLPFRSDKCHGRHLQDYEEYVQARRLVAVEEARRLVAMGE